MNVLVPLDGSDRSSTVLATVQRLRELIPGVEVHLLRVLDPHDVSGRLEEDPHTTLGGAVGTRVVEPPYPRTVETHGSAMERAQTEALDWLQELYHERLPDMERHCHVEWSDDPAKAITDLADKLDVDVIAMATHGRSGLLHLVAGSVAEQVLRTARKPVLVVGPHLQEA
ncbi:MAG: universal stress protein [Dehalococcoidia bacterium]